MSERTARVLLLALLAGPFPVRAQSFDDPPVLGVGDKLQIQVWRQPELSGEFEITSAGTIAHPLYSEIAVVGREIPAVEDDLRRFLAHYVEQPSFLVEALFRVPVGGEVRIPNIYELTPETTVARAVALAGGPTPSGRLDRVILTRNGSQYFLDLRNPGDAESNPTIRSGDGITVERRGDFFRDFLAPAASVVAAIATVITLMN